MVFVISKPKRSFFLDYTILLPINKMQFCHHKTKTKTECAQDGSCVWLENGAWYPFSVSHNGKYVPMTVEVCKLINGDMRPQKQLEAHKVQCGLIPDMMYGNTSFGKRFDAKNSSPKKNFGIFKECWNCIQKEENIENVKESLPKCLDLTPQKIEKYMANAANLVDKTISKKRDRVKPV